VATVVGRDSVPGVVSRFSGVSAESALRDLTIVEAMERAMAPDSRTTTGPSQAVVVEFPAVLSPGLWLCDVSGTRAWRPSLLARCDSAGAVQAAVKWAACRRSASRESSRGGTWTVRALGCRHSWSPYAGRGDNRGVQVDRGASDVDAGASPGGLLCLDLLGLNGGPIVVNRVGCTVTCGAGVLLGDVVRAAAAQGLGLASVPILHDQTVYWTHAFSAVFLGIPSCPFSYLILYIY